MIEYLLGLTIIQTELNFGTFVNTVCYDKYNTNLMTLMSYYVGIFRKDVGSSANLHRQTS